jgi:uncharacterized membrane protein YeaQ/YmgE (transglycosylase-associated protein family)
VRHHRLAADLDTTRSPGVLAAADDQMVTRRQAPALGGSNREEVVMEATFGTGMGVIMAAIVGGVIGWLASMVMKTNAQMGVIANVVVGIVGANLGGWLAGLLGFAPASFLGALFVAILGASLLIAILKALNIFK